MVLIPNKEGYLGKQRCKKDLFRQLIVVVPRAPGMHSGRGVAAVLSNCSSICCSGMWTETTRCSEFVVLSIATTKCIWLARPWHTFKMYFLILRFWNRHEVHTVKIHTDCTTQIDKNRHNRTFCSGVGGRKTTGSQTLSQNYCSLTRNTWYNTTSGAAHWVQPWSWPGKIRKYCGMHTPWNTVMSEHSVAK